jgi:hypothetical protein
MRVGVLQREVLKSKLLHQGMWLGNDDMRRTPPPPFRGDEDCLEVGQMPGAGRRIKLVGEESELPRVGC